MTTLAADAPAAVPMWVQLLISAVGAVGGLGGIAALVRTVLGRRKSRAEAADVITDTALTLVEPLQTRVRELEEETRTARSNLRELSDTIAALTAALDRWRAAIMAPGASVDRLREMVAADPPPGPPAGRNGRFR